jgi:hypothetical protein
LDASPEDDDFIPEPEQLPQLFDVLRELPYTFGNLYFQMQCGNISITDQVLNPMEENLLLRKIDEERTPLDDAFTVCLEPNVGVRVFRTDAHMEVFR